MSKQLFSMSDGEFLLYQTEAGLSRIEVRMQGKTVWLTQNQMAEMFWKSKQNISQQVKAIYDSGELKPAATHKKFLLVRQEGSRQANRQLELYNFDMIISVGYRGNSIRGTLFRIWDTQCLRAYIIKGCTLDDERLRETGGAGFKKVGRRATTARSLSWSARCWRRSSRKTPNSSCGMPGSNYDRRLIPCL